jgi:hypothetical protein
MEHFQRLINIQDGIIMQIGFFSKINKPAGWNKVF